MATGRRAFAGGTPAQAAQALLSETPPATGRFNHALPDSLEHVVARLLEKDRNLRYQTATELKTDLLRLKRDLDSGKHRSASTSGAHASTEAAAQKSIAVLYFACSNGDTA